MSPPPEGGGSRAPEREGGCSSVRLRQLWLMCHTETGPPGDVEAAEQLPVGIVAGAMITLHSSCRTPRIRVYTDIAALLMERGGGDGGSANVHDTRKRRFAAC